ncbi:MAG: PD-(D/E)XK nuclease family protein, partial [Peptococcaceae bacterium]|nr:PD-(D/E)XK nuclease family protein [Peptococcaceae bacterium]
GLALEPREIYDIQPPEIGNFFHDSLEALLKDIKAEGIAMSLLSGEDLQRKVATIAEKQFDDSKNAIFRATAWYSRLSANLHRMLASSAAALAWQEGQGIFQPHAMEVGFGFGDPESLPPVTLDLGHGRKILLRGRIDRIDRAIHPGSGQPYMRIIDYKSGNLDLSLHEIYHGVKLQLILYLEAAKAAYPEAKTAGLFYFRVHDPILTAETVPEALDGAWRETRLMESQGLHGYLLGDSEVIKMMDRDYAASLFLPVSTIKSGEFSKRSRLLSEEDFRILGGHSRRMLSEAGQRIMEGDISLSPHLTKGKSACTYCLYRSVCRFDTAVPGHNYRWLPGLSDDTVLKRLKSMRKGEGAYDGLE